MVEQDLMFIESVIQNRNIYLESRFVGLPTIGIKSTHANIKKKSIIPNKFLFYKIV